MDPVVGIAQCHKPKGTGICGRRFVLRAPHGRETYPRQCPWCGSGEWLLEPLTPKEAQLEAASVERRARPPTPGGA